MHAIVTDFFNVPIAKKAYRALELVTAAVMISAMVDMAPIAMMCFGRSFRRSDEKQQARTMTSATISVDCQHAP